MTEPKPIDLYAGQEYLLRVHTTHTEPEGKPPFTNAIATMPYNPNPTDPYFKQNGIKTWWERRPDQIDGITIHHTLSHNPLALADYITRVKGRPTTEYTFWVTIDGIAYQHVDLKWGCWHDHTGHRNTHISIGMAGRWDYEQPPYKQLVATAKLCNYLLHTYPTIKGVKGHCDYYATACPGWNGGHWKEDFYDLLNEGIMYSIYTGTYDYSQHEDFE